jgi:diguanylate cyclase (GGDEF)-like protein/PAS domain S-box-containing protein
MNTMLDALDCGLLLLDSDGRINQANRWLLDRCGALQPQAGQTLEDAFGADLEPRLLAAVQGCLAHGNAVRLSQAFHPTPLPLFAPGGGGGEGGPERLRQAVDLVPIEDGATGSRQCLLQVRDVSDTVRREQTLRQQTRQLSSEVLKLAVAQREIERQSLRFSEMARLAPVGLFETDAAGLLVFSNARADEQLGLACEGFRGRPWTDLLAAAGHPVDTATAQANRPALECRLNHGGRPTWLRLEATPLQDVDQMKAGHLFTLVDVTDLREQARRNELRANHDGLTGLANRARFEQKLNDAAALCQSRQVGAWVLFIDLDGFKGVNDRLGHQAGDEVLKAVASRLQRSVRSEDLVARLGGDEFAVLLVEVSDEAVVRRVAAKLEKAVRPPVAVEGGTAAVGASIGWSALGAPGVSAAQVLADADQAMYRAKRARQLKQASALQAA